MGDDGASKWTVIVVEATASSFDATWCWLVERTHGAPNSFSPSPSLIAIATKELVLNPPCVPGELGNIKVGRLGLCLMSVTSV